MKLEYTDGCIADSITVDDVETTDMNINDLKSVIHKLIDTEQDIAVLQSTFRDCLYSQGEHSCSDKPCPCCGDYIRTFKLEI